MKLSDIKALVGASFAPEVEVFLGKYFRENQLSKSDETELVKGLEKGDDLGKKILRIYVREKFLCETADLELIELFEKGVEGAKEILLTVVKYWIPSSAQKKLVNLFRHGREDAGQILDAYFRCESYTGHELCQDAETDLIKCLEEGVAGSQELLETYIKRHELSEASRSRLVKLLANSVKEGK